MTQAAPKIANNQYQCAACGGVFEKGWSDAEAAEELADNFPGSTTDDCGLVCDDCYKKLFQGIPQ